MRPNTRLICFLSLLFFGSCAGPTGPAAKDPVSSPAVKKLLSSDTGLFRGANLGMSVTEVKGLEKEQKTEEEEPDYLFYSLVFKDSLKANYYYSFDEGLDEIGVDVFREKSKDIDWLFTELRTYYTKRYGTPKEESGLLIWYVKNQAKEGAEISLSDESGDYGYGKLTLTFFPFQTTVDPGEKEKNL